MRSLPSFLILAAVVLAAAGCASGVRVSKPAAPPAAISASSVGASNAPGELPWGKLGKRLGTQVTIEGDYDAGAKSTNTLWVAAIDNLWRGAALPLPIHGSLRLRPGIHYKLEGYESAGFNGDPPWKFSTNEAAFQYGNFFIVTKIIEPHYEPFNPIGPDGNLMGLLTLPPEEESRYVRELAQKLTNTLVPTREMAESVALGAFMKQTGMDMREHVAVTGLFALGREAPDLGNEGDLIWEVRISRMTGYPDSVSGVVWVSTSKKTAKILFP